MRDNGGEIEATGETWWLFPVWDSTNRRTIASTASHIVRENESIRREWPDHLPPGYLAIAENGGGDYLVLGPEDDRIGFWDHETGVVVPVDVDWTWSDGAARRSDIPNG
jgi:hypothetical protein